MVLLFRAHAIAERLASSPRTSAQAEAVGVKDA